MLAYSYSPMLQYDEAIVACNNAIEHWPGSKNASGEFIPSRQHYGQVFLLRGFAYSEIKNSEKARADLVLAVKYDPRLATAVQPILGRLDGKKASLTKDQRGAMAALAIGAVIMFAVANEKPVPAAPYTAPSNNGGVYMEEALATCRWCNGSGKVSNFYAGRCHRCGGSGSHTEWVSKNR